LVGWRQSGESVERSLGWDGEAVVAVDQAALPAEHRILRLTTVDEVIDAIGSLAIRGAPAIGVAGGLAVALSARQHGGDQDAVLADAERIRTVRPTAVNLSWAVRRVLGRLPEGATAVLDEAMALLVEDEQISRALAARAADVVRGVVRRPVRALTHCNTGRLATVAWGTALGAIRDLAESGDLESVLVTETRPLLQGARLTAWELAEAGIPHRLCVDSAGPAAIASGLVDCVVVGADRITADGDVANKIGTYALAVAAARHGIPFVVVAPESTVDESLPDGDAIVIEQREDSEVTFFAGQPVAPAGTKVYNPAFDVTPAALVTAIVTERRTLCPAAGAELAMTARALYDRGWMDGTAGNLSTRLLGTPGHALITGSGRSKGTLTAADLVTVASDTGEPLAPTGTRPSAEVSIHAALYRRYPACGAVVHAHPPHATAVATLVGPGSVRFADFEIIKGLGVSDPSVVEVLVLPNHADVALIAEEMFKQLRDDGPPVVLIGHHGATTWGPDLETARNRMESLEALCQLHLLTERTPR
jgi:S-methyl-5-thioribose-1-phosphate isomerase/methylthioribulose-1-phosphate dehydratase